MRLTAEREKEIRRLGLLLNPMGPNFMIDELLAEIDALRGELNMLEAVHKTYKNGVIYKKSELIELQFEREKLLAEKESWGNEFNAVIIVKDENLKLREEINRLNEKYDLQLLVKSNDKLRAALKNIQFRLERNAKGEQPYGGFHTVLDEFASIESLAREALK